MGLSIKGYAILGAMLLVVGGLTYWRYTSLEHDFKLEQAEVKRLNTEIALYKGANEANKATIARLERDRELDRLAIDRLTAATTAVAAKADRTHTVIREIERNEPAVADLLSRRLPDSLRDALNTAANR